MFCALAANGHETEPPPTNEMKSRRLIGCPRSIGIVSAKTIALIGVETGFVPATLDGGECRTWVDTVEKVSKIDLWN